MVSIHEQRGTRPPNQAYPKNGFSRTPPSLPPESSKPKPDCGFQGRVPTTFATEQIPAKKIQEFESRAFHRKAYRLAPRSRKLQTTQLPNRNTLTRIPQLSQATLPTKPQEGNLTPLEIPNFKRESPNLLARAFRNSWNFMKRQSL